VQMCLCSGASTQWRNMATLKASEDQFLFYILTSKFLLASYMHCFVLYSLVTVTANSNSVVNLIQFLYRQESILLMFHLIFQKTG
jgi:hypothetical protein